MRKVQVLRGNDVIEDVCVMAMNLESAIVLKNRQGFVTNADVME